MIRGGALFEVTFDGNIITPQERADLAKALASGESRVRVLNLNDCGFDGAQGGKDMAKILDAVGSSSSQLVKLGARDNLLEPEGVKHLAAAMVKMDQLVDVSLNWVTNRDDQHPTKEEQLERGKAVLDVLGPCLSKLTKLQALYYCTNGLGPVGFREFAKHMEKLPIKRLALNEEYLGDEGAVMLADFVAARPYFEELCCYNNSIGTSGAKALAKAFAKGHGKLEIYHTENNPYEDDGLLALAPQIHRQQGLRELDFARVSAGPRGMAAFNAALSGMAHLTILNLSGNEFGLEGCQALAKSLPTLIRLRHLELHHCNVCAAGLKLLAEPLSTLGDHLENFHFGSDNFGNDGVQTLAGILLKLPAVFDMKVDPSGIDADGVKMLVPALASMPLLNIFRFGGVKIGQQSLDLLTANTPADCKIICKVHSATGKTDVDQTKPTQAQYTIYNTAAAAGAGPLWSHVDQDFA